MSRLYYEKSLRSDSDAGDDHDEDNGLKDYLSKLIKLIPAEIVTAYVTLFGFLDKNTDGNKVLFWVLFVICLVLTPIYLNSQADPGKPRTLHLVFSTIAFIIWVYVTSGSRIEDMVFGGTNIFEPIWAAFALVLYVLITAIPLRN